MADQETRQIVSEPQCSSRRRFTGTSFYHGPYDYTLRCESDKGHEGDHRCLIKNGPSAVVYQHWGGDDG